MRPEYPRSLHEFRKPVEVRGRASGRVRLKVAPDVSARYLVRFVASNVAPGAVVLTDAWGAYDPLKQLGYRSHPRC